MTIQERIFTQLSKNSKKKFNKYRAKLGITQDLTGAVDGLSGTLETAQKVVDSAIAVNLAIKNVEDDARFYNDYAEITYEDLGRNMQYIQDLLDRASELANELGVPEEDIDGYKRASDFLIDLKKMSGYLNTHTLEFDI